MLLIHEIKIPIYRQSIYILIGDPYEFQDYLKDIEGLDGATFNPNTTDAICMHYYCTSWIWMRSDSDVSILMHELCHAVFDLMEDVGLDKSDQEAFCYIIQYLVEQCKDLFAIQMDPIKQV